MKEYSLKNYSIYLGNEVFDSLLEHLIESSYTQVFVLVDEQTEKYCLPILQKTLFDTKIIRIKSGEINKSLETLQTIWNELFDNQADKKSVVINLGGGVINDIGGFAASTFKRGIDYVNIPTTLLAMVDSSIGGKLGIDYQNIKNAIGLIKDPVAVYINPIFLDTLDARELRNGFAEMIKHGLIADEEYWDKILKINAIDASTLLPLIAGSIKVKVQVVKKDPHEEDLRKILNFGHTIGHAIEAYSLIHDKKPLKHGEAIAIGMICESFLAKEYQGLGGKELRIISDFILQHYPKYSLKNILSPELIKFMRQDKKNNSDQINFVSLKRIGKAITNRTFSDQQISLALNYYDAL
ncbi:MAG: 3-dehydroquinate synthase [Bacteroidetes bacterium]|nr:MAG: 3-dehydroquinate synthase [Bacteroidota bacterium]